MIPHGVMQFMEWEQRYEAGQIILDEEVMNFLIRDEYSNNLRQGADVVSCTIRRLDWMFVHWIEM